MSGETIRIGNRLVGEGHPCFVVAEVGLNHNGDMDNVRKLIQAARSAGCDAVKFQKRTIDVVYSAEEQARPVDSPLGSTIGEVKRVLELGREEYRKIGEICREQGILWFASSWDEGSVDFMEEFDPPCHKIASACLTDDHLLRHFRDKGRPIILSTGMSTLAQIDHAVEVLGKRDLAILHCTSTYPCRLDELNLLAIPVLRKRYGVPVGYSGHEVGLATTVATIPLGACIVERHITLDRAMWGGDQAASVEPHGFARLVKDIRAVEQALGDGVKRLYESEIPKMRKLRRRGL